MKSCGQTGLDSIDKKQRAAIGEPDVIKFSRGRLDSARNQTSWKNRT
jgi:hypothetical protein